MSMNRPVQTIGIIGSGVMGSGIAQVAAEAGLDVRLFDIDKKLLENAIGAITKFINRSAEKGKVTQQQADDAIVRITTTMTMDEFAPCDLVLEAAPEKIEIKQSLFRDLERITRSDAILATNTSTLSVTEIAAAVDQRERVVGMHFFNPAPLMPLVEVIAGTATSDAVLDTTIDVARRMGKTPVRAKDVPGFIVNRIARPFYLEALRILGDGTTDPATLDRLVREGGGFKMGPFELMDLIGIDVNYAASKSVYEQYFQEPRFRPSILQQRMAESGLLGRKTGRGWYDYSSKT
jgi:3-hydroxybutyryl-CoA dehydrogenase